MNAAELYKAGRLQDAIDAAAADVKAKPADTGSRNFFCELLCFAGAYDRADKQLDVLAQMSPELIVVIAMWRQLLRAAKYRQQFFEEGRLPEFVGKPSSVLEQHLKASVLVRDGDLPAAAALLAEAERQRVPQAGICNGRPFDDLRDLDDMLSPVLEVFTANGKYYWIAWEQLTSVSLDPVRHPRDLFWRPARILVRNGPEGEIHLPVLYPGTEHSSDDAIRLGRSTAWEENEKHPVRGLGQRTLMVGDEALPFLEIEELAINPAEATT